MPASTECEVCAASQDAAGLSHTGSRYTSEDALPSTVLVVDDEPLIRDLLRFLLVCKGFEVIEASDGVEALELCRRRGGAVDVLLTTSACPGWTASSWRTR
jgi:PleD family two-component response regulator